MADLTTITQLQFLFSCSLSLSIFEFIISEISSFAKNLQSQFKIYGPRCFATKNLLAQFQVSPLHSFGKKGLKLFKIPPLPNFEIIPPGAIFNYLIRPCSQ